MSNKPLSFKMSDNNSRETVVITDAEKEEAGKEWENKKKGSVRKSKGPV